MSDLPLRHVCVILGGGGHARVLIDCMSADNRLQLCGILDADPNRWGQSVFGVPILGGDELIATLPGQGVTHFVVGVGSTGDNTHRQRLFELGLAHDLLPLTVRHPSAICSLRAKVGAGSQLMPGSIVNAAAELGSNVIVNSGAIVEHDCRIGSHVHVATGARLASAVRVGDRSHVGAGAVIRQCIVIAEDAVIGAGAVVVKHVAAGQTVIGVPARPLL